MKEETGPETESKMNVQSAKNNFVDLLTVGSVVKKSQEDDTVPVAPKDEKDSRDQDGLCGHKCFVATAVILFLILTFLALPAGSFLIITGRNKDNVGFQLGGALVMCVPILVGIILGIIVCVRRSRRKSTFTSVSTARV